jgi:hypothetical protein
MPGLTSRAMIDGKAGGGHDTGDVDGSRRTVKR